LNKPLIAANSESELNNSAILEPSRVNLFLVQANGKAVSFAGCDESIDVLLQLLDGGERSPWRAVKADDIGGLGHSGSLLSHQDFGQDRYCARARSGQTYWTSTSPNAWVGNRPVRRIALRRRLIRKRWDALVCRLAIDRLVGCPRTIPQPIKAMVGKASPPLLICAAEILILNRDSPTKKSGYDAEGISCRNRRRHPLTCRRVAPSPHNQADLDLHLSVSAQVQIFGRQRHIYDWPEDP
jgi:hypothetical protein